MRSICFILLVFLFLMPGWGVEKKTYVAKSKKTVRYKARKYKKRGYVRYPVRVNIYVSGDNLKLKEMLKDIYE